VVQPAETATSARSSQRMRRRRAKAPHHAPSPLRPSVLIGDSGARPKVAGEERPPPDGSRPIPQTTVTPFGRHRPLQAAQPRTGVRIRHEPTFEHADHVCLLASRSPRAASGNLRST
jgi:hypothetical protein